MILAAVLIFFCRTSRTTTGARGRSGRRGDATGLRYRQVVGLQQRQRRGHERRRRAAHAARAGVQLVL